MSKIDLFRRGGLPGGWRGARVMRRLRSLERLSRHPTPSPWSLLRNATWQSPEIVLFLLPPSSTSLPCTTVVALRIQEHQRCRSVSSNGKPQY